MQSVQSQAKGFSTEIETFEFEPLHGTKSWPADFPVLCLILPATCLAIYQSTYVRVGGNW